MAHRLNAQAGRGDWLPVLGLVIAVALVVGVLRMRSDPSRITLLTADWRCTASHQEWWQRGDEQGRLVWQSEAICDAWARR